MDGCRGGGLDVGEWGWGFWEDGMEDGKVGK